MSTEEICDLLAGFCMIMLFCAATFLIAATVVVFVNVLIETATRTFP